MHQFCSSLPDLFLWTSPLFTPHTAVVFHHLPPLPVPLIVPYAVHVASNREGVLAVQDSPLFFLIVSSSDRVILEQ
jgi:hypothetical protein